jgi:hypothetical protein
MSGRAVAPNATGLGTAAPLAAALLVASGVELVVVGGCALVLREVSEHCGDLDVVPAPGATNLARLCAALGDLGAARPRPRTVAERSVSSVTSPYGRVDFMVATARREYDELLGRATDVRVAGVPVPVAAVADVLRLRTEFGGGRDGE